MNIVFFGMPGCGKGTQAKMLVEKFNFVYISTGDIFREIILKKNVLTQKIKNYMQQGLLVPDEIVFDVVKQKINHINNKDFLFDGFPRNIVQAKMFNEYLSSVNKNIDKVFYFELSQDLCIKRLTSRRLCPKCNKGYNLITQPPKNDELCDICNVKLIQREDDKYETVIKRMNVYEKESKSLLEYYKDKLIKIDATGNIEDIFKKISEIIFKN